MASGLGMFRVCCSSRLKYGLKIRVDGYSRKVGVMV